MIRPIVLLLLLTACGGAEPQGPGGGTGGTGGTGGAGGSGPAGSGAGGGGGSDSGPLTLDDFAQWQLNQRCQAMARCGLYASAQNCVGLYSTNLAFRASDFYGALVAAGRMAFDPNQTQRCLAAWQALACHDVLAIQPPAIQEACTPTFHGIVAEGGACGFDFECDPTQWCNPDAASHQGTCAGRCAPRLGVGASTSRPSACRADLVFHEGVCTAPALGAACSTSLDCRSPHVCATGVCVNPGAVGDACTAERLCQGHLTCVDGTCARHAELGRACDPTRVGDCKTDLWCDATTRHCVDRKGPGAECTGTPYGDCQLTLRCTPAADGRGVCQAPGETGARCRQGTCSRTTYCDAASNTCRPLHAVGTACTSNDECGLGGCHNGSCQSTRFDVCH